jgi:hypothetical protein
MNPAFERWQATFPLRHVKKNRTALQCLTAIGLDVGLDDEFTHITLGSVLFSDSLSANRVPHVFELYEGDHRNRIRERITTRVLPFFSRELASVAPKDLGTTACKP